MPDTSQGLFLLILTMPGTVGFFVFSLIYCNRIDSGFDKVAYVVLLNILAVIEAGIALDITPLSQINYDSIEFSQIHRFVITLLAPLTALASLTGAAMAFVGNKGAIQKFFIRHGITRKTAHASVVADVIATHPDAYMKVRFKAGGYVIGHPRKYSLMGDECCLFLANAARRPPKPSVDLPQPAEAPINGPGILLLNFDDVTCVEVLEGGVDG